MEENRIGKWWPKWVQNRRKRREERERTAALVARIENIAKEYDAHFRAVSRYSKKLVPSARIALDYIQDRLSKIPGPVVLDPEHWSTDDYLNALFVDAEAIRELLEKNGELRSFFDREIASQAVAAMTADWKQKTVLGTETQGETVRRDVARSILYFENHHMVEVCADLDGVRHRLSRRILDELMIQTIGEIQGLQERGSSLEKERELLEFLIESSQHRPPAADDAKEVRRLSSAKQALTELDAKEKELRRQVGGAESQLEKMASVLSTPQAGFDIETVHLHLDRLGIPVEAHPGEADTGIKLAKCRLKGKILKVIVWVQANRFLKEV